MLWNWNYSIFLRFPPDDAPWLINLSITLGMSISISISGWMYINASPVNRSSVMRLRRKLFTSFRALKALSAVHVDTGRVVKMRKRILMLWSLSGIISKASSSADGRRSFVSCTQIPFHCSNSLEYWFIYIRIMIQLNTKMTIITVFYKNKPSTGSTHHNLFRPNYTKYYALKNSADAGGGGLHPPQPPLCIRPCVAVLTPLNP